jgi:hypothetical protein
VGALSADTKGNRSVGVGLFALNEQNFTSSTDAYNIGIGFYAGRKVTTGIENTLIGGLAGDAITTASYNTAVGYNALLSNTTASDNTAVGDRALQNNTTGANNVAIGRNAGNAITSGSFNVILGSGADSADVTSNYTNAFGYNIVGGAGYTTIGESTSDIRAAHGNTTWATVSDERYKKDIVDSTAGLSFVNALQPRTFKYKNLGELPNTFSAYEADSTDVFKNSNTNHGFIAQEVKVAIDADSSIKDGFKLWDDRDDGSQEVAEAALIPVLVKAIQELSAKNDTLETANTALADRITALENA